MSLDELIAENYHPELPLEGKGLHAGEYDLLINSLISKGRSVDKIFKISLLKNTTWESILKLIPEGSFIKSFHRTR